MALFESQVERKRSRRAVLRRRLLAFAVTGAGALFGYRWWKFHPSVVSQRGTSYFTPSSSFYNVSIRPGFRPSVDPETYRLTLEGPAGSESLNLAQIRGLTTLRTTRTLVCVGNGVGGTGMGNAEWTGAVLQEVLGPVLREVDERLFITFHGLDGYYSSVPLPVALDPETVLAFEMNGEPLPPAHGYPLRVLIPDRYGMKQPRWLERIVISKDDPGYWERRGWCSDCLIHMTARIDSVRDRGSGRFEVKGIAFCGGVAVGGVEVSADGENWLPATLGEKALPNAWSTWSLIWKPQSRGTVVLMARVRDARGETQEESYSGAFPSGSTGIHRVVVEV